MSCTTILVGKNASYDGSTMIARNDDSGSGVFTAKKFVVVKPTQQPREYQSVLSKVKVSLPQRALRYTAVPNIDMSEGIWAAAGVNEANVAMTATETITSNARVQGADPLVKQGIGEEDITTLVLPYIKSAREGVLRLAELLERYGTYEMNGIAFSDSDEIWWLETIGGHHWLARRVPDDCYVVMPNQQGLDGFDFVDAFGKQKEHLCSKDMLSFIEKNHLDLSFHEEGYRLKQETDFDVRGAFGSHDDSDHTYNTPRAWYIERYFNPSSNVWDGLDADYRPESDDIPWCRMPERKITIEDVKYALSATFQGTPFDPYGKQEEGFGRGLYRPVGINRTSFVHITQLRPYAPREYRALFWMSFGSNRHNAILPQYANVSRTPEYLSNTTDRVSTDNLYWANRLIAALSDAHIRMCNSHIERYQNAIHEGGHRLVQEYDKKAAALLKKGGTKAAVGKLLEEANQTIAEMTKGETDKALGNVLYEASLEMKNGFSRSDA